MFIKNIQLILIGKSLRIFDVFIIFLLIINIINLIYDILKPSNWIIFDLFLILFFSFYLYFTYTKNE